MRKPRPLLAVSWLLLLSACDEAPPAVTSTIITNAVIHNGSGGEAFFGAVRIDGDRIVEIGEFEPLDGEAVYDAGGQVLAPGFIDTHSHHDQQLDEYRHMPAVLSQGVTTIVRGADGKTSIAEPRLYLPQSDFNLRFARSPAAVNIASFAPHNSIRNFVMGDDYRRTASAEELHAMANLVRSDMDNGALGLATGLEYEPGIYSTTDEVIALARVAANAGGRYMSHVRDEDDNFMASLDELLRIGREAALPVHISHIKLADRAAWGTTDAVIEKLDNARAEGISVSADIYPYERWASNLSVLFPDRDFSNRSTAEFAFEHSAMPEDIVIVEFAPNPEFDGLTIAEIARISEQDAETTLMTLSKAADDYLLETGKRGASIVARGMNDGDVIAFMQWDFTNICTDGSHKPGHPRGYGAFPRVLGRYVRELGALSLEDAVHKMTELPATAMGISSRGRIRTGYFADLVLFDPETIADKATMADPVALSVGVQAVWVNGVLAFDNGAPTMRYPGRIVTRGKR